MARLLLSLVVVLGATWVPSASAGAAAEWCDTDPPLLIETPESGVVAVYLLVGARGAEHLPAALAASLLAAAEPIDAAEGGRKVRVTATVTVPDDHFARGFPTRALVSSGPLGTGAVYAATEGTSGKAMTLRFTLAVP
jgi:hypothetical protein